MYVIAYFCSGPFHVGSIAFHIDLLFPPLFPILFFVGIFAVSQQKKENNSNACVLSLP